MKDIKQRSNAPAFIKTKHHNLQLSNRLKTHTLRSKSPTPSSHSEEESSPNEYASNSLSSASSKLNEEALAHGETVANKIITKNTTLPQHLYPKNQTNRAPIKATNKSNLVSPAPARKAFTKSTKRTVKNPKHVIKSTQHATKTSIQTGKRTYHITQATVKATLPFFQKSTHIAASSVKAIIAATKALTSLIIAGGWISVIVIILLCIIGFLTASPLGIFFSGEDSDTGMTLQTAISEINTEYQNKISEIKKAHPHDVLELSGSRAHWEDVLTIYSVKTTADETNPQEVVSMTDEKLTILKDIFWTMHEVTSETLEKTEPITTTTNDESGNIIETEETVTRTYLYIQVNTKSLSDMIALYGFTPSQEEQVALLLSDETQALWTETLTGISGSSNQSLVDIALSQVGNIGGEPYWSWYGFTTRVEWCATFVSWCADQAGYIELGVLPKFAACQAQGIPWFKERGQWQDATYTPKAGDIIFFDWNKDGHSEHVGIVEKVENGYVHTIEGNSSNMCRQRTYELGSEVIIGYGISF